MKINYISLALPKNVYGPITTFSPFCNMQNYASPVVGKSVNLVKAPVGRSLGIEMGTIQSEGFEDRSCL